ncbi:MAG: hypothetical protein M1358_17640 [Chloroflexi bacterium]|nr:hypothetical protein [Chloroflexota bacterium]
MPWLWIPWINVVLGLWLVAMPFVFTADPKVTLPSIVIGLVITFIAFFTWTGTYLLKSPGWAWASWIVLAHGLGAIALPFVLSQTGVIMASYIVTGLLVSFLALAHWLYTIVVRPERLS